MIFKKLERKDIKFLILVVFIYLSCVLMFFFGVKKSEDRLDNMAKEKGIIIINDNSYSVKPITK